MSLYIIGNLKCFPFYELTNEIHVFIVQIIAFTRVSLKGGGGTGCHNKNYIILIFSHTLNFNFSPYPLTL